MCDPLWTNKCGLCGSLMVPDTQVSDAMCQLQLLSNFFIPVSSLPMFSFNMSGTWSVIKTILAETLCWTAQ